MTKNNAIVITSIIAGVILILGLLALNSFNSIVPSTKNSVTVQGMSTIKTMPDLVSVYFNIESKGKTSAEATTSNTEIYDNLVEEMIIAGFEETDIKTESFSVYPNTYWEDGREKTDGYKANHYIKVEISSEKMNKVTDVIDAGVTAGAGVSYINFELSQESQNKYKSQALKAASEDAMIKADSIASGFGKTAGKLLSVQTSDFGYYPWNVYTASGGAYREDAVMAKEAAVNIQPGEQEVSASVTATFQIK
jgi:uncharacterized protein YggE